MTDADDLYTAREVKSLLRRTVREALAHTRERAAAMDAGLRVAALGGLGADVVLKALGGSAAPAETGATRADAPATGAAGADAGDMAALLLAGVQEAEHARAEGEDVQPALDALHALRDDPGELHELLGGAVAKAFDAARHPRGDDGRFVSKKDIAEAQADPAKAEELKQRVTDPEQRKKLDAALGDASGAFVPAKEHAKRQTAAKREKVRADRHEAQRLAQKIRDDHNTGRPVSADDLHALVPHLSTMTHDELSSVRTQLFRMGANFGGTRRLQDRANRLAEWARGAALDARMSEHGFTDDEREEGKQAVGLRRAAGVEEVGAEPEVKPAEPEPEPEKPEAQPNPKLPQRVSLPGKSGFEVDTGRFDPNKSYAGADGKEPWQMSAKEWEAATDSARGSGIGGGAGPAAGSQRAAASRGQEQARTANLERLRMGLGSVHDPDGILAPQRVTHEAVIAAALEAGKPVPPEVLADYPDLAAKYATQQPTEEPTREQEEQGPEAQDPGDAPGAARGDAGADGRVPAEARPEDAAPPEAAQVAPVAQLDDAGFAKKVQQVADEHTHGFNRNKVYIGDVYDALKAEDPTLTREEFNKRLTAAHVAGRLGLNRADLVQFMNPEAVANSAVPHPSGAGEFHFIESAEKDRLQRERTKGQTERDAAASDSAWAKTGADRIRRLSGATAAPGELADALRNYARNEGMLSTETGREVDRLAREHIARLNPEQQRELAHMAQADARHTGEMPPALAGLAAKHEPEAHQRQRAGAIGRLNKIPGLSDSQRAEYAARINAARGDSEGAVADAAYGVADEAMKAGRAAQQQPAAPSPTAPAAPAEKPAKAPRAPKPPAKAPDVAALKKKPGADHEHLTALAAAAPDQDTRDWLDVAAGNTKPTSSRDMSPEDRRHLTIERLAAVYRDSGEQGKPQVADHIAKVIQQFGGRMGDDAGKVVPLDPSVHGGNGGGREGDKAPEGLFTGAAVRVVRPAVYGPDGGLALKAHVEPAPRTPRGAGRGADDADPTDAEIDAASKPYVPPAAATPVAAPGRGGNNPPTPPSGGGDSTGGGGMGPSEHPDDHAALLERVRDTSSGSLFKKEDGVELLRRYGIADKKELADPQSLAGKLASRSPQQWDRKISHARQFSSPEVVAALERRRAEVEADPTTNDRSFYYDDANGREKEITYAQQKAWRATPGRSLHTEDEGAGYDADRGRRTISAPRRKGDAIPGVGVVTDARYNALDGKREYLVRPFTKKEKAEDVARHDAALAEIKRAQEDARFR